MLSKFSLFHTCLDTRGLKVICRFPEGKKSGRKKRYAGVIEVGKKNYKLAPCIILFNANMTYN